jgi:hypothetical protein
MCSTNKQILSKHKTKNILVYLYPLSSVMLLSLLFTGKLLEKVVPT